ncbi:response regulator [Phenylobacterium sp. J367]|uniref:response regulator n=1 Tax=Phenylobacterium sp. J367 TaxID=2898435 RepID=UPI0021516152|nr:response regulator [Phenylobacterium sp. J367]MCR5879715.1 response regulator [Phenylobacterium sp. J367]
MDLSATRILIVEDHRQMIELIRSVLAGFGARDIEVAASPTEAWALLERRAFDLLIVDRTFHNGDGLDLVRRIRRPGETTAAFLPILMLTGSGEASVVAAARDAGVSEYLVKPFTVTGFHERMMALIFRPRPFVQTQGYFGPDRRRRQDPAYRGRERRG